MHHFNFLEQLNEEFRIVDIYIYNLIIKCKKTKKLSTNMELTKGIYENMKMTMNTCLISFDTRGTCIISTF